MSEQIRVLQVFAQMNRGGAETMIMNLYRNIDRSKTQFDFIVHTEDKCDYDEEIRALGGIIYRIPRYVVKNHFEYKRAWNLFFQQHPGYKIVHGHVRSTASIYLKIAKNKGLKTIAHSHSTASRGNRVEQFVKNIMQLPIRSIADYLFACSDEAGKWLFGEEVIKRDNYIVVKNGIDIEKNAFNDFIRIDMRKSLNIEDKFVIGHVGSFTYPKNHKFLLDIFYEVQKKEKNVMLLLIGDGELRSQLEEQTRMLGIKDKVIFTGVIPNVFDYMQAMDLFVFPSIFEGLGIVMIEAQASGLPCIVSSDVPEEACITNLVSKLSLSTEEYIWALKIVGYCKTNNNDRRNTSTQIKLKGYDIYDTVKKIELLYTEMYHNEELK
jgi:glycosyltransferase involved in cell wall biosynthesis